MPSVTVRNAVEADLPAIQAIYAHHVLHGLASFEEEPPTVEEISARRTNVLRLGLPYLAGELGGEVVGYSYAGPYRPRPAYRFTVENSIYLKPAIHRRGIGLQLLLRLIEECESRGYRQMVAVIGDSANAGSVGVHARTGFEMIGTHPNVGLKFGRWLDTVMMQRALGAGAATVPPDEA